LGHQADDQTIHQQQA